MAEGKSLHHLARHASAFRVRAPRSHLVRRITAITLLVYGCGTSDTGDTPAPSAGQGGSAGSPDPGPSVVDPLPGVVVSVVAGSSDRGASDGPADSAMFSNPTQVAIGPGGELIVADFDNFALRRIATDGTVSTLTRQSGFIRPFGLAFTPQGSLFAQTDGVGNDISTVTNYTGALWQVDTASGQATLVAEELGRPRGLASLPDGRLALSDPVRHCVRLFDPATGQITVLAGQIDIAGYLDGDGTNARFSGPYGIALRPAGDLVLADYFNHRIRIVTLAGHVSTLAGDGVPGMHDGPANAARFRHPQDVAVDSNGNVFVSDAGNHRVRIITSQGTVRTVAGSGVAGFADGEGTVAQFFGQEGIDSSPDGKTVYVADGNGGSDEPYHRVRRITLP